MIFNEYPGVFLRFVQGGQRPILIKGRGAGIYVYLIVSRDKSTTMQLWHPGDTLPPVRGFLI